eukprot:PITA_02410
MASTSYFKSDDKLHDTSDYHACKMSLDLTLEEQDVMDYVQGKIPEPPSNALVVAKTKYKKGEVKAKKIIRDSIHKHLVAYISDLNTSKEIYYRLVGMFKSSNANQILFLKNKLKDIKKGKGEDIQSYFMGITEIKNDFLSIGEAIADRELTLIALGGLPPEWHVLNTTILNNDKIIGFEELLTRCSQEETRMMELEMPSNRDNPTAFSAHAKRKNNADSKKKSQGRSRFKNGRKGRCFVCNKFGHYARECPIRRGTSHDDDHNHSRGNNNNHRNGRFNNKGKRNASATQLGNDRASKRIRNSRHDESNVVNSKQNEFYLISSLSTASPPDTLGNWLIDSGASSHFTGYKEALSNLIEKDTNLEIILGDNATYPVKGVGNVTLQLNQGNTVHLQEVLYVLDLKKNLVSILTMEDKGFKLAFIDGKLRVWKRNFKEAFTLGFKVDSLYHVGRSPLGDMPCDTSLQVELWHRRFAYLHYKALPDARKMVIGMFEFKIEHEGEAYIKRATTTAYTSEQNGVVERKNRSIIEATRVILHDQGLPKFLWGVAAKTVVYVQNRCPHQALDSKTLEEVFTSKKLDVSHFRIFGSPVYFHVPKEKRSKLEAFGKKGALVGYNETSKAYRVYVLGQREEELSHDVTFNEDVALRKISNLPIARKDKEVDAGNQGDSHDELMPDVVEPMDPIDPPLHEPFSSKRRPLWLRETLEDADTHVAPRGTFRERKKPNRYQGYLTAMSTIIQFKPCSFEEDVKQQVWKDVMNKDAEKFKARFVARGFSQKEDVDYDEIFAPVARYTTIRSIIALAASQGWNLQQMDVKIAFLHGSLKEEVYVELLEGFEVQHRQTHVSRLEKSLYGLKQAPRAWYERIDRCLMKLGSTRSEVDPNLYFKVEHDKLLTGADPLIHQCKRELASEFDMKDLGLMHYFLGLEVWKKPGEIFLS